MEDIKVVNHGSLIGFMPVTTAGREWLDANLPDDTPRHGDSWFCQPRYADNIIQGMLLDDLIVEF